MKGSNIQVAIRKRPLLQRELEKVGRAEIVDVLLDQRQIRLLDPEEVVHDHQLQGITVNKNRFKETHFTFDQVFDERSTTQDVFTNLCEPFLSDVLEGFNATVFAYGATGSGKTYTMVGSKESPGLMDLVTEKLFGLVRMKEMTHEVIVKLSYMEIHNENLHDLLSSEVRNLELREDPKSELILVHGLTEVDVVNVDAVEGLLRMGSKNRTKDTTAHNDTSSRSHGILQLTTYCVDKAEGLERETVISKLSLVDLAGSEKASSNKSKASKLEGAKINQSLLMLGNCIQTLSDNADKTSKQFIPYRGSKLTRLLKDSLGGNCRTIMIANISGSILGYEDIYNTLLYANRAKNIRTFVQRNIVQTSNHVSHYASIIENLNKENDNLRQILNGEKVSSAPNNHRGGQHNSQVTAHQLDAQQSQLLEQLEQAIRTHFDDEIGHLRAIQEAQMKLDKIQKLTSSLQLDIRKNVDNTYTQHPREQLDINKQEMNAKHRQMMDLRSTYSQLVMKREKLSQKVKQQSASLPPRIASHLHGLISIHETASANLLKEFDLQHSQQHVKEKSAEISELKAQLNLRENIINQQKSLLKVNSLNQVVANGEHQASLGRMKDADVILSSIIELQDTSGSPQQDKQFQHHQIYSTSRRYAEEQRASSRKSLPRLPKLSKNIQEPSNKLINMKKMPGSLNNISTSMRAQISQMEPSSKTRSTNSYSSLSRPKARFFFDFTQQHQTQQQQQLNQQQQPSQSQHHKMLLQGLNNSNTTTSQTILSQLGSNQSIMNFDDPTNMSVMSDAALQNTDSRRQRQQKLQLQQNKYSNYKHHSMLDLSTTTTNSNTKKIIIPMSPAKNNTVTANKQSSSNSRKSAQKRKLFPSLQMISAIASSNPLSPGIVKPLHASNSVQRKNVFEYDVHQSPYVKSFKQEPQLPPELSRKTKLEQLNLNIDHLKEMFAKKRLASP